MRLKNQHRLTQIKDIIQAEGYSSVEMLAERFSCSPATIRRDLQELEQQRLIARTHGGAYCESAPHRPPQALAGRPETQTPQRLAIARHALAQIQPGDTIYLDPGPLGELLATLINQQSPAESITVVTSSVPVFMHLAENRQVSLIVLGGQYQRPQRSFTGPATKRALTDLYIGKYFITTSGIVAGNGLTESSEADCEVKKAVLARSHRVILLAESSRFDMRGLYLSAPLSSVHQIITDGELSPAHQQWLSQEPQLTLEIASELVGANA